MSDLRRLCLLLVATLVLPGALADHDSDPVPDEVESLVCGYPNARDALDDLASATPYAGRCTGADHATPLFTEAACSGCSELSAYSTTNTPLTPSKDVQSVRLPPEDIPRIGPIPTPPVNQPVGTVQGYRHPTDPQRYCVSVTPKDGSPLSQCVSLGAVGPMVPLVPPTTLVNVSSVDVGPTPGVNDGQFGSTPAEHVPATSFDLDVAIRWDDARLFQRLGPGLVNTWEPVDVLDAADVEWWSDNGERTSLDVTLVLRADGVPVQAVRLHAPFAGQAAAAALKTVDAATMNG